MRSRLTLCRSCGCKAMAEDAGTAMKTLRRATKRLGIVSRIGRVIHWRCGQEQFWATLIAL
jgi:hypothetical protein